MDKNEESMLKDTSLYMVAKILEGIIGFITIIVYTYCFLPEHYGIYNIINSTVVTVAFLVLNWISQSLLRYIDEYNIKKDIERLYSTVLVLWLILTWAVVIIMMISILVLGMFVDRNIFNTLWLMLIMFVFYGANLVLTSILVAQRRIKLNLILSVFNVFFKLVVSLLLIWIFGKDIRFIIIANIIFDAMSSIIIFLKLKLFSVIKFKLFSKDIFKRFISYGFPLIGLNFSTSVLYNSDRYIIQLLLGSVSVGIYYANYSLMSAGFSIISSAMLKASYPAIMKAWNDKEVLKTRILIGKAVRQYLLISIPALFGIAVMAEDLSRLVLNEAYIEGFSVMKWVALGMVLLGLTEYVNKTYELKENTQMIFKNSMASGIVNILLNFCFLPMFGYKVAAVTTAIGFFAYFILALWHSDKECNWILDKIVYIRIFFSAALMAIILKLILVKVDLNFISFVLMIILGVFIYGITLILTGELKEELKFLMKVVRR